MSSKTEESSYNGSSDGRTATNGKATLYDVARRAGVSHVTVSRFFRQPEKLSPTTRARVKEAVKELHYVPNAAARSLVQGKSALLSLLVADITNPFFTTLARGVEDESRRHGYILMLGNTDETPAQEGKYVEAFVSHQITGVVMAPSAEAQDHLRLLLHRQIPIVLVDRSIPGVQVDLVRGDTRKGTRQLVEHFVEQGYRDIAFLGGDPELSSLRDRLAGYKEAMLDVGLPERTYLSNYLRRSGEKTTRDLLESNKLPEAILAANNTVAEGILLVLREKGIRTPADVALACVDEVELSMAVDPFMTVVRQPAFEMGKSAMRMLIERINGANIPPRELVVATEVIVRRSSIRSGTA